MPEIHVFDTYATRRNGRIMHFDVVLPVKDAAKALSCAIHWLGSIGEEGALVTQERCCYCHSEATAAQAMEQAIAEWGYAIYPMEGCPVEPG
jgi:Domain of unknown function (DUF2024)